MLTALFINKKRTPFDPKIFLKIGCISEIANFISCQFHCHPNVTTNDPGPRHRKSVLTPNGYCMKIPLVENHLFDKFFEKNMKIGGSHNFCKKKR